MQRVALRLCHCPPKIQHHNCSHSRENAFRAAWVQPASEANDRQLNQLFCPLESARTLQRHPNERNCSAESPLFNGISHAHWQCLQNQWRRHPWGEISILLPFRCVTHAYLLTLKLNIWDSSALANSDGANIKELHKFIFSIWFSYFSHELLWFW